MATKKALAKGDNMDLHLEKLNFLSRDNGRTPMQWNGFDNAGFTSGKPWLPVNENYTHINVEKQSNELNSVLNYFREMAKLRNENPVLIYGSYELLNPEHGKIYAYSRKLDEIEVLVLLNFSTEESNIELLKIASISETLINNYDSVEIQNNSVKLQPYQSVIFKIE